MILCSQYACVGADCVAGGSVSMNTWRPCDDCRGAADDEALAMRDSSEDVLGVESINLKSA